MNIKPNDDDFKRIETELKTLQTRMNTLRDLVGRAKEDVREHSRRTVAELQAGLNDLNRKFEQFKKAERTMVPEKKMELGRASRGLHESLEQVWDTVRELHTEPSTGK